MSTNINPINPMTNETQSNNNESASAPVCELCNEPITDDSLGYSNSEKQVYLCIKCTPCAKCGRTDVTLREIIYCLDHGYKAILHAKCIAITKDPIDLEVDLLNLARLILHPDPSLTRTANQTTVISRLNQLCSIHKLNHEQILLLSDSATALATGCNLILGKNRRVIEEHIDSEDKKKNRAVEKVREESSPEKKAERKAASAEDKAIEQWTKLGFTKEQAIEFNAQAKASKKDMLK